MYILIIVGFLYGSSFAIQAEALFTIREIKFQTEKACKEVEDRLNKIIQKRGGRGEAFCVKDG